MTPKAITSALPAAQVLFLPIHGQPSNNNLVHLSNTISPILFKTTYNRVNGIHNLWGLIASTDRYLHYYSAPFIHPATGLACYDPAINGEVFRVNHVCTKIAWAALIQDYKAYEAAEHGVKVFIEAAVNHTWICDLRNPETFYSNVTSLAILDHLWERSGGLNALDMVSFNIQMSQYYEVVCPAITNQTLIVLASTALLAANTFPCTTELWEELDPADKTWAAWKTAYLAAHKKRADRLRATGGADYLGGVNSAHATTLNPGLLYSINNALNNLASAASNKKAILEQLIASNASLATSNSTLTNQVKTLHDQIAAKSRGGSGRGGGSNDPNKRRRPNPAGYCWSQGYHIGHGRTGHTCSNPKEGHQPTTMHDNIMGGSIANKDWTPNRAT
jgi:hypothetical protein